MTSAAASPSPPVAPPSPTLCFGQVPQRIINLLICTVHMHEREHG